MLCWLAILVLKALATLSRVILRIFSWKSEFKSFLTLSASKSNLGIFGDVGKTSVFCFGSSWSVFSRNCIILLASNISLSFSGTKSLNLKSIISVIGTSLEKCITPTNWTLSVRWFALVGLEPKNFPNYVTPFVLGVGTLDLGLTMNILIIPFCYLLHASWKRQTIFFVSYLVEFLVFD